MEKEIEKLGLMKGEEKRIEVIDFDMWDKWSEVSGIGREFIIGRDGEERIFKKF